LNRRRPSGFGIRDSKFRWDGLMLPDPEWYAISDHVVVRTLNDRHEAEFYRSVIEAHGIAAAVSADDAGAIHPALALAGGVHVLVAAEDADQAAEILDDAHAADSRGAGS